MSTSHHEREFEALDEKVNYQFVQELLTGEDPVMPTAMVAIRHGIELGHNSKFVAFQNRAGELSGLPTFDLADLESSRSACRFIFRRFQRLGLEVVKKSIEVHQLESKETAFLESINNTNYPHIHRRIYIPVTGYTINRPDHNIRLTLASREQILEKLPNPLRNDHLSQLYDIHHELFAIALSQI